MTVHDINRTIVAGHPVVARYRLDGHEYEGRILRARLHFGRLEVFTLDSRRWVWVNSYTKVWQA